ncbi:MAG: phosphoribosyl-ATP diphosphatase [Clostridiales Family XIII bacterium]|jgi:phosphoribosyl-ATP pyrophosphohydrolase|nr:phosphoribosyl-ATP diphosphatase [Clostridiales Family XIII bacterium]
MDDIIKDLYDVISSRKAEAAENSYTAYLFREGIDKILKKIGEEASETIIAAKSLEAAVKGNAEEGTRLEKQADLENEFCDLLYHMLVLLAEREIPLESVMAILEERAGKSGNLKKFKTVNKDS